MKIDYLIIGQGLAGTSLAWHLLNKGKTIKVIEGDFSDAAFKVAPGSFNAIVFKRLTKSWKADYATDYLREFYAELQKLTGLQILQSSNFVRIFNSLPEANLWDEYNEKKGFKDFISGAYTSVLSKEVYTPFGWGQGLKNGKINIHNLINGFKTFLKQNDSLISERFCYNDLKVSASDIEWKGIHANKVIFCEGYGVRRNPYFDWLPFVPAKGEILEVKFENFNKDLIVSGAAHLSPTGKETYWIGGTYNWEELNTIPTKEAKEQLIGKLIKTVDDKFEVINHIAGIRPTTKDRRPFMGVHKKYPNIAIFNGLGTKGALLSPYLGKVMANFINGSDKLDEEMDILRFY